MKGFFLGRGGEGGGHVGPIDRATGMNIALQVCTHSSFITHIATCMCTTVPGCNVNHVTKFKKYIYIAYSKVYGTTDGYLFPTLY